MDVEANSIQFRFITMNKVAGIINLLRQKILFTVKISSCIVQKKCPQLAFDFTYQRILQMSYATGVKTAMLKTFQPNFELLSSVPLPYINRTRNLIFNKATQLVTLITVLRNISDMIKIYVAFFMQLIN